jgi:hypothetical protein
MAFFNDTYARTLGDFELAYSDLERIFDTDDFNSYNRSWWYHDEYKTMVFGTVEPDYDDGNLIPESAMASGFINEQGEFVPDSFVSGVGRTCLEYLQLENGKQYRLVMPKNYARQNAAANPVYIAEYTGTPENPVFQRIVTLNQETLYTSNGRLVRPFVKRYKYDLWLAKVTDAERHEEDANIIVPFFDYLSEKVLDWRGMIIRTGYGGIYPHFDMLHPKRTWYAKRFRLTDNIINLTQNSQLLEESYSILVATFRGKTGGKPTLTEMITYEIPGAMEKFGSVYHAVDFARDNAPEEGTSDYTKIVNQLKQYADVYNPLIPSEITLNGLDPAIFSANGEVIDVGDPVNVESPVHGISRTVLCLSLKIEAQNPQNNEYRLGEYIPDGENNRIKSLTASFAKEKKKKK